MQLKIKRSLCLAVTPSRKRDIHFGTNFVSPPRDPASNLDLNITGTHDEPAEENGEQTRRSYTSSSIFELSTANNSKLFS